MDAIRGFLPGFAYQWGVLLAGPVDVVEATFAQHMCYATAMAMTAGVVFAVTVVLAAVGREKKSAVF